MAEPVSFEYAVLRVVPRVERGEAINAGVIVYCRDRDYLRGATWLDVERLRALDGAASCDDIVRALEAAADCTPEAGDALGRRFHWLTAPRSTVVQPGPVHTGVTAEPEAELRRLFEALVLPVA